MISTARIVLQERKAASCPFQIEDCHIGNHSSLRDDQAHEPQEETDGCPSYRESFRAIKGFRQIARHQCHAH
jgi:hypothetical protein